MRLFRCHRRPESLREQTRRVEDAERELRRAEALEFDRDDAALHHWTHWAEAEFDRSDADSTAAATEEVRRDGRAHGERPARPGQADLTTPDKDDGQ